MCCGTFTGFFDKFFSGCVACELNSRFQYHCARATKHHPHWCVSMRRQCDYRGNYCTVIFVVHQGCRKRLLFLLPVKATIFWSYIAGMGISTGYEIHGTSLHFAGKILRMYLSIDNVRYCRSMVRLSITSDRTYIRKAPVYRHGRRTFSERINYFLAQMSFRMFRCLMRNVQVKWLEDHSTKFAPALLTIRHLTVVSS